MYKAFNQSDRLCISILEISAFMCGGSSAKTSANPDVRLITLYRRPSNCRNVMISLGHGHVGLICVTNVVLLVLQYPPRTH